MYTGLSIVSGQTVPSTYTWDKDVPFSGKIGTSVNIGNGNTTLSYISGYAPGLRVVFRNNSSNEYSYNITEKYEWNFGDYYNSSSNVASLPCPNNVEHIYVMPGIYNVTINHTRSETPTIVDPGLRHCQSSYNYQWYWDNLMPGLAQSTTWDDLLPGARLAKTWNDEVACFDKYCSFWSWPNLSRGGLNPYTWDQTNSRNGSNPKKWTLDEGNVGTICNDTTTTSLPNPVVSATAVTYVGQIEVKELLPTAGIALVNPSDGSLGTTTYGTTPITVQLTPRTTITGSFPIDRIDWDMGDSTGVYTVTRFTTADTSIFVPNNQYSNDPSDPRNYDIVYTYRRNKNQHWLFYPSLTAYASSTGSHDSASLEVGPINLQSYKDTNIKLLKVRNTTKGNLYTLDVDGNIVFATTNKDVQNIVSTITVNSPPNRLVTTLGDYYIYKGNPGIGYPPLYSVSCELPTVEPPPPTADIYLVKEEDGSTPILLEDDIDPVYISYDEYYIIP